MEKYYYKYVFIQCAKKINLEKIVESNTTYFEELIINNRPYNTCIFMPYFIKSILNNMDLVNGSLNLFI